METEIVVIAGRECHFFPQEGAEWLVVQPIDKRDLTELAQEIEMARSLTDRNFSLVAFPVLDWNRELPPWTAPPVFGKEPFGDGATDTLRFVVEQIVPAFRNGATHIMLCGYSLAALFALWAGYQTDAFDAIAAASPSVWYPRWIEYAGQKKPLAQMVYLSLGDKEANARNPVMAQVGQAIRQQYELLAELGPSATLEWNPGNHFVDAGKRMARGIAWILNKTKVTDNG